MITIFKSIFTIKYLSEIPTTPMRSAFPVFIVLGLSIIAAIIMFFLASKKRVKFEKTFFKRSANALLYTPILLIIYVFMRSMSIGIATQRIIFLALVLIWLIWLMYLVYYRLVVIPEFMRAYNKKKTEERYLKYGKGTK